MKNYKVCFSKGRITSCKISEEKLHDAHVGVSIFYDENTVFLSHAIIQASSNLDARRKASKLLNHYK